MFSAIATYRAEVLGQRRVDVVAVHRRLYHRDDPPYQPTADDPERDGGQDLHRHSVTVVLRKD